MYKILVISQILLIVFLIFLIAFMFYSTLNAGCDNLRFIDQYDYDLKRCK